MAVEKSGPCTTLEKGCSLHLLLMPYLVLGLIVVVNEDLALGKKLLT